MQLEDGCEVVDEVASGDFDEEMIPSVLDTAVEELGNKVERGKMISDLLYSLKAGVRLLASTMLGGRANREMELR